MTTKTFNTIYSEYYPKMLFYSRQFVPTHVGEDIVLDAFVGIWERNCQLTEDHLRNHLYTRVKNACINHIKNEKRSPLEYTSDEIDVEDGTAADYRLIHTEVISGLYTAIEALPGTQRRVIELFISGRDNNGIADLLNLTLQTVINTKGEAIKSMKKFNATGWTNPKPQKLTPADVRQIKNLIQKGVDSKIIANTYDISLTRVSQIKKMMP